MEDLMKNQMETLENMDEVRTLCRTSKMTFRWILGGGPLHDAGLQLLLQPLGVAVLRRLCLDCFGHQGPCKAGAGRDHHRDLQGLGEV